MGFYSDFLGEDTRTLDSEKEYSVTTGIVKENWDADHPGMVKVELFLGEEGKNLTGWIPVMTPYAGNAYGNYALPEVGDTVVIAFDRGDRNCPIVIGSLWDKVNKLPDETAVEKNNIKRFTTKGGCEVVFDDTDSKNKIEIFTKNKLNVTLEDENQKITVADEKGENGVEIDCKGGALKVIAKKTVEIQVNGNSMATFDGSAKSISLKATKIEISADQGLTAKGASTQISGTTMEIKGDSSAKVESSAILTLKGSMVKIN